MFVLTNFKSGLFLIRFITCEGLAMMLNSATINTALLIIMKKWKIKSEKIIDQHNWSIDKWQKIFCIKCHK